MREQVIKVRLSDREWEEVRRAASALGIPQASTRARKFRYLLRRSESAAMSSTAPAASHLSETTSQRFTTCRCGVRAA